VPDAVGVVRGGVPRRAEDVGDLVGVMVRPVAREVEARTPAITWSAVARRTAQSSRSVVELADRLVSDLRRSADYAPG
jgi:hypothetical protein